MIGAIIGDVVGSRFEFNNHRSKEFELIDVNSTFTDDTVLTIAIMDWLTNSLVKDEAHAAKYLQKWARKYPYSGYGGMFKRWINSDNPQPYGSYGNGAAMRISPVGWVCDSIEETIELSKLTTEITHNHPEGIKGAEAVAVAIFMARTGKAKKEIKSKMVSYYPDLANMTILKLKASGYGLDEYGDWITCQGSVPQAICAFLESTSFEDAIRKAVSLGGDSDTQAAIAGSIAEAYYGLTYNDEDKVMPYLPEYLQSIYFAFDLIKKKKAK